RLHRCCAAPGAEHETFRAPVTIALQTGPDVWRRRHGKHSTRHVRTMSPVVLQHQKEELTNMATRNGSASWEGTLKGGKGTMRLGSGAYEGPYSFSSRFEEAAGTNPEELIGAAEAGCFSMALSFNLEKAGHPAKRVSTTATVKLEPAGAGFNS